MLCTNGDASSWKCGYTYSQTLFSTQKPNYSKSEWVKCYRNRNRKMNWLKKKDEVFYFFAGWWERGWVEKQWHLSQMDFVCVCAYCTYIQIRKFRSRNPIKVINGYNAFSGRPYFSKSISSSKHPERVTEFS